MKEVGVDYTPEPEMQPLEEILKAHLEALKSVQEAIDRERKQLGDQSEAYARQLKEEAIPNTPAAEHVLDPDTTEHVMKAMGQAGILFTWDQQKELERNLAETLAKRCKTVDIPVSG